MAALHREDKTWADYNFDRIIYPSKLAFIFCGWSGDATLSPTNLLLVFFSLIKIGIYYQKVVCYNPPVICSHRRKHMTGKNVYLNLFRKNWFYDFSSESFMWRAHVDSTMWNRFNLLSPRFPHYTEKCAKTLPESGSPSLNLDQI